MNGSLIQISEGGFMPVFRLNSPVHETGARPVAFSRSQAMNLAISLRECWFMVSVETVRCLRRPERKEKESVIATLAD